MTKGSELRVQCKRYAIKVPLPGGVRGGFLLNFISEFACDKGHRHVAQGTGAKITLILH
jgi:hypothetical protein